MLFNSIQYLTFFLSVLALSWMTIGLPRLRLWILLIASYYFYMANNHWVIILLFICTLIDYFAGICIEDSSSAAARKRWLIASMTINLGMLCVFKYFHFLADSFFFVAGLIGLKLTWVELNILLPVGISFYTFESMSYTIDVYRGDCKAERSYLRFSFFLTYFPHLIAGPIVRPRDFMPQIDRRPRLTVGQFETAMLQIAQGLLKKIVLADYLAIYADAAFDHPQNASAITALLGVYAFAFQIYYDFSGYSDIAIGCSRLMCFELRENFRRPYAAVSITDFWRRWHISLSTWLRDYLYIPLGGSRMPTRAGVYRNLMITMVLGGLWHGAAWHFVIWGAMQGLFLLAEKHFWSGRENELLEKPPLRGLMAGFITFHLVCLSWIVFRAHDNAHLTGMFAALCRIQQGTVITLGMVGVMAITILGGVVQNVLERRDFIRSFIALPIPVKAVAYACVAALVTVFGSGPTRSFIYFQF